MGCYLLVTSGSELVSHCCRAVCRRVFAVSFHTWSGCLSLSVQELDKRFTYFVVVQMDRGLGEHHPGFKVKVPQDLDIVGFMAGGCSICEHFRYADTSLDESTV